MNFKEWLNIDEAAPKAPSRATLGRTRATLGRTRVSAGNYMSRGRLFGPSGEYGVWRGRYAEPTPWAKLVPGAIGAVGELIRKKMGVDVAPVRHLQLSPQAEFQDKDHVVLPLMLPKDFTGKKVDQEFIDSFASMWDDQNQQQNALAMLRPVDVADRNEVSAVQSYMLAVAKTIFWRRLHANQQLGTMDFNSAQFIPHVDFYGEPPSITVTMQINPIQRGPRKEEY